MKNVLFFVIWVAVIVAAGIGLYLFEKKTNVEGADERQILEMYKSFTLGFFLLICFNLISFLAIDYLKPSFHLEILFPISIALALTGTFEREIIKENLFAGKLLSTKSAVLILSLLIILIDFRYVTAYQKTHGIENIIIASTFTICFFICMITAIIKKITTKTNNEE